MDSKEKSWTQHLASAPDVQGIATHKKLLTKEVDFFDLTLEDKDDEVSAPITSEKDSKKPAVATTSEKEKTVSV